LTHFQDNLLAIVWCTCVLYSFDDTWSNI